MSTRFIYQFGLILLTNVITGCTGLSQQQGMANATDMQTTPVDVFAPAEADSVLKLYGPGNDGPFISDEQEYLYKTLVAEVAAHREQYELSARYFLEVADKTNNVELAERATRIALYAQYDDLGIEAGLVWVRLAPNDPYARRILGSALLRENRIEEAIVHLEAMLDHLDEDQDQRLELIASLLEQQSDQSSALKIMAQLVEKRQQDVAALLTYARLLYGTEALDDSLAALDQVLLLQPNHEAAVLLYANVLNQQGRLTQALHFLAERLANVPEPSEEWRFVYARLLAADEQFEAALAQFALLYETNPDSADILYALGLLSLQLERNAEAKNHFMALLEDTARTDLAYFYLGQIAEREGDPETAVAWYSKVSVGSDFLTAQARIALILEAQNGLEAALTHLREVPLESPEQAQQLLQFEAELLLAHDRYQEALTTYDRALAEDEDNIHLLYARAMTAEKADRLDILEQDLRRILELEPQHVEALNALGYTLADRTDRYEEAYELIQQAYDSRPDSHYIADSMGWVLYRLGRYEEALEHLRKALALRFDPEIAAHLGEVLWVTGQLEEAKALWEKARAEFPEDDILQAVMERFLQP